VKRGFWVALGLGAGATGTVIASRWTKKQAKKVTPAALAREARGGLFELSKLMSESIAEGKRAMAERERELRDGRHPGSDDTHGPDHEPAA
jgi:hypothetical protein